MEDSTYDVVIIGAGLSGLLAARLLREAGLSVVVLDKGRGVGGRLATRRLGLGRADHGAQFFTVRDPDFAHLVDAWQASGLVFEWSRGWSNGSLDDAPGDGYPRFAVSDGFTSLAKQVSAGVELHLATEVALVEQDAGGWSVQAGSDTWRGRGLLLTPPVPQSLALLDRGGVNLAEADRTALDSVAYAPCLCGLFRLSGGTTLPEPGALQRPGEPVSWIADNQRKGISPAAVTVTVHANPEQSKARWLADESVMLAWLEEELRPFLAPGTSVEERQLKRWRYALPTQLYPHRYLMAKGVRSLVFAGDAFGGPRVEGAALSGMAAGLALAAALGSVSGQ